MRIPAQPMELQNQNHEDLDYNHGDPLNFEATVVVPTYSS